jgi:hypothetical protein
MCAGRHDLLRGLYLLAHLHELRAGHAGAQLRQLLGLLVRGVVVKLAGQVVNQRREVGVVVAALELLA